MQLGDFLAAGIHLLPQHPVLLRQHIHHLVGACNRSKGLPLQVGVGGRVGEMCDLDWRLGLGRWRSLELLLLLLLILMVVLLMMVHPWGGAIWVMRETVTSWRVHGPLGEGFACLVGARTLWAAGPHTGVGLSQALGVLVRERGMGGVGSTEHAAEDGGLGAGQ